MKIEKTGFILYTINYRACLDFYKNILGLKILYQKETLTCFDFHGSYLMVEIDDETNITQSSPPKRDRTCLRINVENVKEACSNLDEHNIPYNYGEYDWGTVAKFRVPDGNLVAFRSAREHEEDSENA